MYEYQRRLLNEAAKHGKLSPKETQNLPEECRDFIVEGVNVMKGAEKLVLNSGLDVGTYRKLLNVLRNRLSTDGGGLGGHAMILDITTPTGPGARRGNLTGQSAEIKIVKIADIGKYEFNGYDFKGIKLGNKAERTWSNHKGQAVIIALNESVFEEVEQLDEVSDYEKMATKNLHVSNELAKKKDKKHDSQWGFGYRGYLRAFLAGNASKITKIDNPDARAGFNAAKKDLLSLTPIKEEVESLDEASLDSVARSHQMKIARSTVKMNPAMVGVMGGMTIRQAHEFLLANGTAQEKKAATEYLKRVKEEVESLDEAASVKASKAQIDAFKSKIMAFYANVARKRKDDSLMKGANVATRAIDDWAKKTGGDVMKLPDYFNEGSRDKTKFEIAPVNDFVKSVLGGGFKITNNTIVKEEVEDVSEAVVKDELTKFLLDLPKQAKVEISQLAKKMNGLPSNSTTKTAIKAILTKHKAKLLKDLPTSITAIMSQVEFFLDEHTQEAEGAETISESDFKDIAKHNLEVSTKLALKKDKKHDSQWGVGYRGYLRLVVSGNAISKNDVPSGKTGEGWNAARNDIITGKKLNEEMDEAYAPTWAYRTQKQHPILGQFKYNGNVFEYRAIAKETSGSNWALSQGLTHEVFFKPVFGDRRDVRFAIIKATVAQVAVDEKEDGKPVFEKWAITAHRKYPDNPSNPTGYKK